METLGGGGLDAAIHPLGRAPHCFHLTRIAEGQRLPIRGTTDEFGRPRSTTGIIADYTNVQSVIDRMVTLTENRSSSQAGADAFFVACGVTRVLSERPYPGDSTHGKINRYGARTRRDAPLSAYWGKADADSTMGPGPATMLALEAFWQQGIPAHIVAGDVIDVGPKSAPFPYVWMFIPLAGDTRGFIYDPVTSFATRFGLSPNLQYVPATFLTDLASAAGPLMVPTESLYHPNVSETPQYGRAT